MKQRTVRTALALSAILVLAAACDNRRNGAEASGSGDVEAPAETAPAPHTEPRTTSPALPDIADESVQTGPQQPPAETLQIDLMILSREADIESGEIGPPSAIFDPNDTVFLAVRINEFSDNLLVEATWIDSVGNTITRTGTRAEPHDGGGLALLSMSMPNGWPTGRVDIEVAVGSKLLATTGFEVQ